MRTKQRQRATSGRCLGAVRLAWLIGLAGGLQPPAQAIEGDVVVACYQGVCREGDFEANLAAVRAAVARARECGSHFLVFPEAFLSGYESRESVERGARRLDDPLLRKFVAESQAHEMVLVVGLARRATDGLYNTVLVIQGGRLLGYYDKIMLTSGDRALGFVPGVAVPVFYAHGVRFAAIICHDTSFPHVAMAARYQGAELLFTPHNNAIAPETVEDHLRWVRNCHVGLASQFKMAVARANVVSSDRPDRLGYGGSFILSPQGEALAEAELFKPELITARITRSMFQHPYVWADLDETPAWMRARVADLLTAYRTPTDEADLRYWLENMLTFHSFTPNEVSAATGMSLFEVDRAIDRLGLRGVSPSERSVDAPLRVLPYPGGRHPRVGFLEGAVMPQRETKVSVFPPWADGGYVVVDVPEAIFSNLGLTYLAHTHIPTIWDRQGIELPRLEWNRRPGGVLDFERTLPNGIAFGSTVVPTREAVRMEIWLRNGTTEALTGLRVQTCVMLKAAPDFAQRTGENKILQPPYIACRSVDGARWIVTAWNPLDRVWQNPPLPCMHSDPRFPDCPPGETVRIRGWLSFYAGTDLEAEIRRIESLGWRDQPLDQFDSSPEPAP